MKTRAKALLILVAGLLAVPSCRHVFTDAINARYIPVSWVYLWLLRPDDPAVTFTSPEDGETDVAPNRSVIVSFNEPVDLPGENPFALSLVGERGAEEIIDATCAAVGACALQIVPTGGFEQYRTYRVTLEREIVTARGKRVDTRGHFPLTFTAGRDDDYEQPKVIATEPLDYQSTGHERPAITVQFDDEVVLGSGSFALYRYNHAEQKAADEPEDISYEASYAGSLSTIAFRLRGDLEEYAIYQAVVSGVKDTSGNIMAGNVTDFGTDTGRYEWRFFTGPVVVAIEPASNHEHGFGTFGDPGEVINGEAAGYQLLDRQAAIIHGRVGEDGDLGVFFDTTGGDAFPDDVSAIRILHSGRNLAGDFGLTPLCKSIPNRRMAPPPKGAFYVDPRWGRFMLPRPAYWSRMETAEGGDNLAPVPECRLVGEPRLEYDLIKIEGNYMWGEEKVLIWLSRDEIGYGSVEGAQGTGKFGNCLTTFWESDTTEVWLARNTWIESKRILYPFGDQALSDYRQGTISFWGLLDTFVETHIALNNERFQSSGESYTWWLIKMAPSVSIKIYKYQISKDQNPNYAIIINGEEAGRIQGEWVYVYITWEPVNSGSARIRLRLCIIDAENPQKRISVERIIDSPLDTSFRPYMELYGYTYAECQIQDWRARAVARAWNRIDNLKWYTHNVTDDPEWEYNVGTGREYALHPVYGEDAGYMPMLSDRSGVGYFFIPYIINHH